MIFKETKIKGAYIIELEKRGDHRGFFARSWCREEFAKHGGNHSLVHIDFMIGSDKLDIDGLNKDGSTEAILRKGEWAFDV